MMISGTRANVADASRIAQLRDRYLAAQLAGDRHEALRLVLDEGVKKGIPVGDLQAGVVQAAQLEIGRLWQDNRISIADEHMATAISHVALSRLFESAPLAERFGQRVVVACVQGEMHDFPARLVADYLDIAGFHVRYLGANVPLDDLVVMLCDVRPDLLALSVTMTFNMAAFANTVRRLRAELPGLPIVAGGNAIQWEPDVATAFGVATCEPDARSLVETARRAIRESRR